MGYKCANDGIEFQTKKALVAHMLLVHDSPFLEGDEELVQISENLKKNKDYQAAERLIKEG